MIFAVLIYGVVELDSRLRILINNYAKSQAKIISNSLINQSVFDYLESKQIKYEDLLNINKNENGTVTSVEFNTVEIAKIQAKIISMVQEKFKKDDNITIFVPIGTLSGSQFLNNRGPRIRIELATSSAAYSKISSKFISAGINQTLHQITLTVNTDVYFVMPWYRSSSSFQTEYILTETIIVGEVPEAYTNVIEYPGSNIAGEIFDYSAEFG